MEGFAAVARWFACCGCSRRWGLIGLSLVLGLLTVGCSADTAGAGRRLLLEVTGAHQPEGLSTGLQLLLLMTVLSLAPAFLVLTTSFARTIIVLAFVCNALGVPMMPVNQILTGLALFLIVFIMAPVWQEVNTAALQRYLARELSQGQALEKATRPVRSFMLRQTREKDNPLFITLAERFDPTSAPAGAPSNSFGRFLRRLTGRVA